MRIEIPKNVDYILRKLKENTHDAYIVGGCVRDAILGQVPNDWDITTSAKPKQVKEIFRRTVDTGIEHGTVTVLIGNDGYEVTTYRIDGSYSDNRHPDEVIFTDNLREDLRRRDFTINAMAYNPERGLVDEFGGIDDLRNGIIRAVGDPDERFTEDSLRILRALRFSARLGFTVEDRTLEAILRHGPELQNVSPERIFTELNGILLSDHPEFLAAVFDAGIDRYICEGFAALVCEDAVCLRSDMPRRRHLRWADLCRRITPEEAEKILLDLKTDNETLHKVTVLCREVKKPMPETETEIRRKLCEIGPELFDDLAILLRADRSITDRKECILERGDAYNLKMLDIDGKELIAMGYRPGPQLGDILEKLLDAVIEDPSLNQKEKLKRSLCE